MNIFISIDYRSILRDTVAERKEIDPRINYQGLAQAMRIQKSYLSKVLKGSADLNSDQLYLACKYLQFNSTQLNYLEILLELEKTTILERKEKLLKKVQKIQEQHLKTQEHIEAKTIEPHQDLQAYYLNPWLQIVHMSLSIERYSKDIQLLSRDLMINAGTLAHLISELEQMGIIERKKNQILVRTNDIHLPKDSPWYSTWRTQLKLLALQRLQVTHSDKSYNFSVVFSADEKTRLKIHAAFLSFLKSVETEVKKAPAQNTYQMNFDLFGWTL